RCLGCERLAQGAQEYRAHTWAYRFLNAGITSLANQVSCSLTSFGPSPSAQWIMKLSRPGYFASIDLMPSMTSLGGPQNHAFCATPSLRVGVFAGAPGEPQVRPCSSAYLTNPNGATDLKRSSGAGSSRRIASSLLPAR